jgi:hypothetical protein
MFKGIGIATAGVAIGVPVWGVVLVGVGLVGAGIGIGYLAAGLSGAVGVGVAALTS